VYINVNIMCKLKSKTYLFLFIFTDKNVAFNGRDIFQLDCWLQRCTHLMACLCVWAPTLAKTGTQQLGVWWLSRSLMCLVGAWHTHTHTHTHTHRQTPELLYQSGCRGKHAVCDPHNERDTCGVTCHWTTPCFHKNSASDVNTANESCPSAPRVTERLFRLTLVF